MNIRYSSITLTFSWLTYAILFVSLLLLPSVSQAQEKLKFSIAEFEADPFDLSARTADTEKYDGNGDRYAIIKLKSTNPDDKLSEYLFNFGNMNHKVEEHDGVLWIYVQRNAKLVTITRSGYVPINKYDLHTTIESGKNYIMTLTSEGKKVYNQMVQFNVNPAKAKAVVMVKSTIPDSQEEFFGNADESGSVARRLEFGTYTYKVISDKYHNAEGRFTLNNRLENHVENIVLRPNFSDITLKVDADADIYVNGELLGRRQWSGPLKAGNYHVECRQTNHKTTSQYIKVEENDNRTILLNPPQPILGTLSVTSKPLGADISVDGKEYGLTPKNIEMLVGQHEVVVSKQGFMPEKQSVEVKENITGDLNVVLGTKIQIEIKTNPTNARIYIDGVLRGNTPYTYDGNVGEHQIRLEKDGYLPLGKKAFFGSSDVLTYSLQRKVVKDNEFYFEAGAGLGSDLNMTTAIGMELAKFNLEVDYSYSFKKAPVIYWNYVGDEVKSVVYNNYKACKYSPSLILAGKLGYCVAAGARYKITPQLGVRFVRFGEESSSNFIYGPNCLSMSVGIRGYFAISTRFGISLSPEYAFGVNKSEGYKMLTDVSSKIKNYAEGFNAKIAFVVTF